MRVDANGTGSTMSAPRGIGRMRGNGSTPVQRRPRTHRMIGAALAAACFLLAAGEPSPLRAHEGEAIVYIEVTGNRRIETDVILIDLPLGPGMILSRDAVTGAIVHLMKKGYFSNVQVDARTVEGGVALTLIVTEHPMIREIEVKGCDEIKEEEIREFLDLEARQFLDMREVKKNAELIRTLYTNKGFFSADVRYEIEEEPKNNQVIVTFRITENKEIRIRKITFIGNRVFDEKALKKQIETKEKGIFSFISKAGEYKEALLESDIARLTVHYLNNGYLNIDISDPEVMLTDRGIYVAILVHEGDQYSVGDVKIENADPEAIEALSKKMGVAIGDIFSREKLQNDMTLLTEHYSEQGYAFAEVKPRFHLNDEEDLVNLVLDLDRGERVRIEEISISGNTRTRDKVVRRELVITEGDLYSDSGLKRSRGEVYRLGFFEKVDFNIERGSAPDKIRLNIDIEEGQTGSINGGVGFSSMDKFIVQGSVAQKNLFGLGQELSLSVQWGGTQKNFSLSFTEPWLFDIPLSAGIDLYRTERNYTDFSRDSLGGTLRFGYPIYKNKVFLYMALKHERTNVSDVSYYSNIYSDFDQNKSITNSVTWTVVYNTLNHRFDPSSGFLNRVSLEYADRFLSGENAFIKLNTDSRLYIPLYKGIVFYLRGRLGHAQGIRDRKLPLFERYFVGGIYSVRGFDTFDLGPRAPYTGHTLIWDNSQHVGGNKQIIFNGELIFPIVPSVKLKGFLFFDAGNAYHEDEDLSFQEIRMSYGFGFKWQSPMGPLILAVGYPIDRKPGEDPSEIQFSIGY
ncbi:outer membrane protein assembly factor BamA [Thermodesulfobacteriota bacterium]